MAVPVSRAPSAVTHPAVQTSGTASEARAGAGRAGRSRWMGWLGRFGFASQGISFAIVALLALALALGKGGKTTDPQGAFKTLEENSWGRILLISLAAGFCGYAIWRFAQSIFDRGDEGGDAKGLGKRAVQFGQGLLYVGLAATAVRVLLGANESSGQGAKKAAAGVLGWPGGESLVVAAGIAVILAALVNGYWGLSGRFKKSLRTTEMTRSEERWLSRLGTVGFLALAVVLAIVGWFLIKAGLDHRADETITIGGALAKVAHASYGPLLLGVTAAGLLAFGLFGLVQARYHRV
jgi:hypothetical protein